MTRTLIFAAAFLFSFSVLAEPLYQESYVSAPDVFPANHGSSVLELPGGQLLTCWYAGTAEKAPDVQIQCSHYTPESGWEEPRVAVAAGEKAKGAFFSNRTLGNAVLHRDDDGVIWLFYSAVTNPFNGWSGSHVDYKTSTDLGETWSESKRLVYFFGKLTKNKPIPMGDHKFMLPLYSELIGTHGFTCTLTTSMGAITEKECRWIFGSDQMQPTLVHQAEDKIYAYLRGGKSHKAVMMAEYDIEKNYWGKSFPTNLPNPDAGVDAVLSAENKILMAYNPSPDSRYELSLAVSEDGSNGRNFTRIWDFDRSEGGVSYPALIRASDGLYHLTYTFDYRSSIKHVVFNEEWLRARMSTVLVKR
jgi:predicted neuraminidase